MANTASAKIPTTVITGFLGAGKTTLIRHLLENAKGRRLALIINEFGDVGVDGELVKGCNDAACPEEDIVELAAYADREGNPLYPVPKLMDKTELTQFYRDVMK